MDSSLSIVVTRNSKSKHCHASVYNRVDAVNDNNNQVITETIVHDIQGSASTSYSGTNITVTGDNGIGGTGTVYAPTNNAADWDLQITERAAGTIETINIDRTITTDAVTSSYSIFSQ
tara:strand:+ start:134 stop:487 length:354 start_codon:yes stop_codon:yes gene_type:complete